MIFYVGDSGGDDDYGLEVMKCFFKGVVLSFRRFIVEEIFLGFLMELFLVRDRLWILWKGFSVGLWSRLI